MRASLRGRDGDRANVENNLSFQISISNKLNIQQQYGASMARVYTHTQQITMHSKRLKSKLNFIWIFPRPRLQNKANKWNYFLPAAKDKKDVNTQRHWMFVSLCFEKLTWEKESFSLLSTSLCSNQSRFLMKNHAQQVAMVNIWREIVITMISHLIFRSHFSLFLFRKKFKETQRCGEREKEKSSQRFHLHWSDSACGIVENLRNEPNNFELDLKICCDILCQFMVVYELDGLNSARWC